MGLAVLLRVAGPARGSNFASLMSADFLSLGWRPIQFCSGFWLHGFARFVFGLTYQQLERTSYLCVCALLRKTVSFDLLVAGKEKQGDQRRMRVPSFVSAAPAATVLLAVGVLLSSTMVVQAELTSAFRSDFDEVVSNEVPV